MLGLVPGSSNTTTGMGYVPPRGMPPPNVPLGLPPSTLLSSTTATTLSSTTVSSSSYGYPSSTTSFPTGARPTYPSSYSLPSSTTPYIRPPMPGNISSGYVPGISGTNQGPTISSFPSTTGSSGGRGRGIESTLPAWYTAPQAPPGPPK